MPRTEEQYEKIREERKEVIMQTALRLFSEHGFNDTSISKIAQEAKISKGLIYNYFESKEDLIKQIVIHGFETLVLVFDPNKDGFLTDEEFVFFIDKVFEIMQNNREYWKLYFATLVQPDVLKLVEDNLNEVIEPFMKTLVDYYQRKKVKNPFAMSLLLGAMLDGVSMNYIANPDAFPVEDIKEIIIEKFGYINNKNEEL